MILFAAIHAGAATYRRSREIYPQIPTFNSGDNDDCQTTINNMYS